MRYSKTILLKEPRWVIIAFGLVISCNTEGVVSAPEGGLELIARIEAFRTSHDSLPNTLNDLGFPEKEESKFHYKKNSDTSYVVWTGTTLGESLTFNSVGRQWSDHQ